MMRSRRVRQADSGFPFVQIYLARALINDGKVVQGLALLPEIAPWRAHAYVRTGRRAESEKHAAEYAINPWRVALVASRFGETDRAVEALRQVVANEPHRIGYLLIQPEVAPVLDYPRVVDLRKSLSLP